MRLLTITTLLFLLLACSHDSAQTYYEKGCQLMEQGDAPAALEHFQQAADKADDDSLLAMISSDMGRLLFFEGLQEQSFAAYRQAYEAQQRRADTLAMACCLFDMANVCRSREHDDSCLYYFDLSLRLAQAQADTLLVADINSQKAGYYLWKKDYARARNLLLPALQGPIDQVPAGIRFMAADLFHHTGPADSARLYIASLLSEDDVVLRQMGHKWQAEQLLSEGLSAEAARHLEQYELLTDSLMEETDTEAMRRVDALYNYNRHQQQSAQWQRRVVFAVALVVVLACLLTAILLYFSRRRLYYQLKVQRLEKLLADYRQRDVQHAERQQQILTATPIRQRIEQLLSDSHHPSMTDEDWIILKATIEKSHPGFVERLQSFHRFSPHEMHVNLLLKIGLTPAEIAQLTAHAKQSVSSARARLYEKVFGQKGTPSQWDEFIQSL
ncbi:MAG: hypothetical protein II792_08230 [Prevotella sp.]|nr:hypothetical protein [Prevotella sp.]